ncbi:hypothetical protein BHE74_00048752 [Ensete ventricosum]|nr:hypothetical protein BHE74_00048752 [Ensete ventricosum]RZS24337.1 hypothetical protein BHM03_00057392 [Ensete ventricosum]
MKVLNCFKDEKSIRNARTQRRLSLGEYRRAVSWSKYLVSYGGEIKGGREEQWSADMSKLLIGNKFATGRHSRIYHGKYKERDVAIKLMSQPEEDAALAAALEQQFTSEVALLPILSLLRFTYWRRSPGDLVLVNLLPSWCPT